MHKVTVGHGAPVVMVHCMLARHESLLPLAGAIGGQATLFDLPGHGRSPDWDGSRDYQAQAVAWAAACCDEPAHLVGHSFGATVALRLAVERPDLVNRLTLIEPVYFAAARSTPEHADHAAGFRPFLDAMAQDDHSDAARHFNALWGAQPWDRLPPRTQGYLMDRIHLVTASSSAIEDDPAGITSAQVLAKVAIPVTLIRGADSPPVIGAIHAALAQRVPDATDHVVAGAGHMLPLTHTAEVAALIRAADRGTG
ncbi:MULTISPECIES: alpha/beta hydrolase [unclassified Yoonia]|uniref:alpha/beta fold hydrolase n=1 Tax=unclassified Yoonia TaxID=2629118 RepID=UPI002AFFC4DE|nr:MULTISPECIES: alpha/beta hydrolase [unclassified Yoonia]